MSDRLLRKRGPLTGEEFRRLRQALGLSQEKLAWLLGVKELTVARWEKGQAQFSISVDAVVRLMAAEASGVRGNMREMLRLCGNKSG